MRDANGLLPLVLVAVLLGGSAYMPRSAGPVPARDTAQTAGVSGADTRPPTRTEIELVADYFAIDVNRLAYLRAVACARDVVKESNPILQEQVERLMTSTGGTAPADLLTRIDLELALAGNDRPTCNRSAKEVLPLLRDYLGDDRERVQLEVLHERIRDHSKIDFVVAVVPDPVDSNGRWQFDPLVDALQRAVAESGYVLDRFALPDWVSAADPDGRSATARHEREPSAIVFRQIQGNAGRDELLVVFLVYETATAGVHQQALGHAISTTSRWQKLQGFQDRVRMLGPTYSGSISSIRRVLAQQLTDDSTLRVRVVSGGATAGGNRAAITSVAPDRVSYHATLLPDDTVLRELAAHIETMRAPAGGSLSRTALLIEGNTSWGKQLFTGEFANTVVFPFPLHISRLRSVTARERPADPAALRAPSRFLPLNLDDPIAPADQLPSSSPRATATSVELILANLLSTIHRDGIATVGILATDTRDKLFLAQQITQFSPDVTVFTTEPDLLFTHPDFRRYTRGLVVGSTYPMFNGLQPWTTHVARRLQFGSMTAQGVYNAMLALLNYDEQGVPRSGAPELVDYGIPNAAGASHKPPLWIGVVGTDAIWPVQYVPVNDGGLLHPYRPPFAKDFRPARPRLSPWTIALLACVALLAMYHVLVVLYHARSSGRVVDDSREPSLFDFYRHASRDDGFETRSPYLAACLVSLLPLVVLGGLLSFGAIAPDEATRAESWGLLSAVEIGWALLALGLLYGCVEPVRVYLSTLTHQRSGLLAVVPGLVAVVLVLAIARFGLRFIADVLDTQKLGPFVLRAGQPFNGVSPVVPLVLLAIGLYFWASAQLQRVSHRSSAGAFARAASAPYDQLGFRQFCICRNDVASIISEPVKNMKPALLVVAGAAIVVPVALVIVRGISTVEHYTLGTYFLLSWVLIQGLVVLWVAHAFDLWVRFRALLRALAGDATAAAFDAMPPALFSHRFAVKQPGPEMIRRIGAEAALLRAGVDDALVSLPAAPAESAIVEIRNALRSATPVQMPDLPTLRGPVVRHIEEMARPADWSTVVASGAALHDALVTLWPKAHERAELQRAVQKSPDVGDVWLERAEALAMMPIALLLREMLARVMQTLFLASGGVLLMVAVLASMPVHSRQTLVGIAWIDVFALSAIALTIFIQADRDELLSRVTGSRAGRITWDGAFVGKALLYAGIPLLTLFASQFPELTDSLGRWLQSLQSQLP